MRSDPVSTCTRPQEPIKPGDRDGSTSCVDEWVGGSYEPWCDGCSHWFVRAFTLYAGRPPSPRTPLERR